MVLLIQGSGYKGHTVDVIYLDFVKAFEFVNHTFLFSKMKSLGLDDVVLRWIEECLSGRVSRVHVGGEFSEAIPMCTGFPQGSVRGTLLFLFFVNNLPGALQIDNSADT